MLTALIYLPYRILPGGLRARAGGYAYGLRAKVSGRWSSPSRLALAGIVLSVVLIQFFMRQCLAFNNLLLASNIPQPCWLRSLILDEAGLLPLYFSGLMAGTVVTGWLLVAAWRRRAQDSASRLLTALLAFMLIIQFLFLPINFGILFDKELPRVSDLGGQITLDGNQEAWLVWEGKGEMTYLVRSRGEGGETKRLIVLPRKDVKSTEIISYDPILRTLFLQHHCP